MAQQRRKYGPEFKRDALKLVAERRSVASVGRGLGIDVNTLHGWRARLAENPKRVQSNRVLGAGHPEHRPRLQQAIYINGLRYGGELRAVPEYHDLKREIEAERQRLYALYVSEDLRP